MFVVDMNEALAPVTDVIAPGWFKLSAAYPFRKPSDMEGRTDTGHRSIRKRGAARIATGLML
jgi:hypothetical protein